MNTQLVEIQPRELKFMFELKKQSSVSVHLANVTDQYVAFKVKTTSPKKYCVRPNVGIIKPKSTHDFTVTMQAQKAAPSEMQCKDKFLIQSSVVPYGTTEDEITPGMFSKESLKHIEETKLRVLLISAPNSPAKPQVDVVTKQEASYETFMPKESHSPVSLPVDRFNKQEPSLETKMHKDNMQNGVENPLPDPQTQPVEPVKIVKSVEEPQSLKVMDDNKQSVPAKKVEFYPERDDNAKQVKDLEEANLKLKKDIEDLRSKISFMNSNLVEAKHTIEKLKEEKNNTIREKETLKQDLAKHTIEKLKEENTNTIHEKETLKQDLGMSRRSSTRKIQVGFPPLFVCMVAIIGLMIGSYFGA